MQRAPDDGKQQMAIYRLYMLNAAKHIESRLDFQADDDAKALEWIGLNHPGNDYELWEGSRKVAVAAKPSIDALRSRRGKNTPTFRRQT